MAKCTKCDKRLKPVDYDNNKCSKCGHKVEIPSWQSKSKLKTMKVAK